jgi:purine-binding chemotaxis protein CheW
MAGKTALQDTLVKLLRFEIGDRPYVTEIDRIQEIVFYRAPIPVPHAPTFLAGLMDLRGTALPLIDLRERLGVPVSERAGPTHILVVRPVWRLLGVIVDRVNDVVEVDDGCVQNRETQSEEPTMCRGVCRVKDDLLLLIDLGAVLGPQDYTDLSEVV